jgi:hypothetical protein
VLDAKLKAFLVLSRLAGQAGKESLHAANEDSFFSASALSS